MNDERYPQPIANFTEWYDDKMSEITRASSSEQIDHVLHRIREYADAKPSPWCFPHRLTDAEKLADKVRKGWQRKRITGEGEAA